MAIVSIAWSRDILARSLMNHLGARNKSCDTNYVRYEQGIHSKDSHATVAQWQAMVGMLIPLIPGTRYHLSTTSASPMCDFLQCDKRKDQHCAVLRVFTLDTQP